MVDKLVKLYERSFEDFHSWKPPIPEVSAFIFVDFDSFSNPIRSLITVQFVRPHALQIQPAPATYVPFLHIYGDYATRLREVNKIRTLMDLPPETPSKKFRGSFQGPRLNSREGHSLKPKDIPSIIPPHTLKEKAVRPEQ
jgi:hypothetical protein